MRLCILALTLLAGAAGASAMPADSAATAAPISATMTARNAGSAQWFFAMAPDHVLPLLPANTRLDMLDYYNSGIHRASADAAGARAIVTASAARSMRFETGDTCRFELAVFPLPNDTLVALIETIAYPVADSRIAWYDSEWRPVTPPLRTPGLDVWLTREGKRHRAEVEEALPFISATAEADPEQGTITLRRTIDAYFLPQERPAALDYVKPEIVFRLKGKRFEP